MIRRCLPLVRRIIVGRVARHRGAFGLSMNWRQRSLFASLAKRDPPRRRVHELGVIAGLRGV
jgi:hypothetical protein